MRRLLIMSGFLFAIAALAQTPALPNFIDNNELTCGFTGQCVTGSPAITLSALPGGTVGPYVFSPIYEYILGASQWVNSTPPPACSFSLPYATTFAGACLAIAAVEACRSAHNPGVLILDTPPVGTTGQLTSATSCIIPQTNTTSTHATSPIIVRTSAWANLEAMPEPVGAGGIQNNILCAHLPCQIGLRNPSLDGVNANSLSVECPPTPSVGGALAYQLAGNTFCIPPGPFTLADGTVHNTANYNYLQYMTQLVATGSVAPLIFCSVAPGANPSSQVCNSPGTLPQFGPDLWYFEGIVFSEQAGNHANMDLVKIQDNGGQATSIAQWASHIHFRRIALLGDWTNLGAGSNQIATGMTIAQCFYCSLVGSSGTQLLRPTAEGHVIAYNGAYAKISNNWLEGQSSCIFAGGGTQAFNITPVGSFISNQDIEHRRTRCTFPLAWLNANCGSFNVLNSNPYWGGAGDCPSAPTLVNVNTSGACSSFTIGLCLTYVSGPQFHDSTSFWPGNNVFLGGITNSCWNGTKAVKCSLVNAGSWPDTTSYPPGPSILLLSNPVCNSFASCTGALTSPITNVGFILNGASVARKNCDEKKSGLRVLYSGNIDENVDNSGGQRGICLVLSTRNTSGGGQGSNYQDSNTNYNIQNNIFANTCEANTLGANSASSGGNGGGVAASTDRVSYYNNASLNVTHSNPGCPSGSSVGFQINIPFQTWTGTVTENGAGTAATFVGTASIEAGQTLPTPQASLPLVSDAATYNSFINTATPQLVVNITNASTDFAIGETVHLPCAGCAGDPGSNGGGELQNGDFVVTAVTSSTLTFSFNSNTSTDPGSIAAGTKVQGPVGFQVFNIATGFPVVLSGTSCAAFTTPTSAIGPITTSGSAAWTGSWTASNVTVTFPWSTTANSSAPCTIANVQGRPRNLYIQKQLMVTDAPSVFGTGNAPANGGSPYALNNAYQDILMLNSGASAGNAGWFNPSASLGEGNVTEKFVADANTLTATTLLIPRPFGAKPLYNEYCGNSVVTTPCTPGTPPTHMFFPCSNGDPCTSGGTYASCQVGFVNACTGNIPLNLPDYHSYALAPTSPYFAASSTGGPLDVDFAAIDAAQTANTYVPMVMGSPVSVSVGPFPDSLVGAPPPPAPTAPAAKAFAELQRQTIQQGGTE